MNITVWGTGGVGKAIAAKFRACNHEVCIGTRDPEKSKNESLAEFLHTNPDIGVKTFNAAAGPAEVIVNATKGAVSLDIVKTCRKGELDNKIFIDIGNPLDFSHGPVPILIPSLCNTTSLGEEIQKLAPKAMVVKTLNTMWNGLMVNPSLANGGQHINYICGNDGSAKNAVRSLLKQFGWKEEYLLDIGDITGARAMEATLPIWLRVYGAKKTGAFNFNIVT